MQKRRSAEPSRTDAGSQIERVVLLLREMVLRGDFKPGERLAELALVPRLRASRTPVRLALERLAHEGLLDPLPAGGFRLRAFTPDDVWDAIELRGVLEGTAARLATERLRDRQELEPLRVCYEAAERLVPMTLENFVEYTALNERFHHQLWALAKSPMLVRAIQTVVALPFAAPGALVFSHGDPAEANKATLIALDQHRAIVESIEGGEGTRAESVAREHARVARRYLDRALDDTRLLKAVRGAPLIHV